jgi:hypothetical protein
LACLSSGNDQDEEHASLADGIAELTRDAMTLIINERMRRFPSVAFLDGDTRLMQR